MTDLIESQELVRWVPGQVLAASAPQAWKGLSMCSYRYQGLDVPVPAMRDFMIVVYRNGMTPMNRRVDAGWLKEKLNPGHVSLLTRAEPSHWCWTQDIDVVHLYLTLPQLSQVCAEVFDREIDDVRLRDILKIEDPVLCRAAASLYEEAQSGGVGGRVYGESIANQLCVHILRRYSTVSFRPRVPRRGLSARQAEQIETYVEDNLERPVSLEQLAGVLRVSPWHFMRQFKLRFGCPPHAFIVRRRVERAKALLGRGGLTLKDIAQRCGFTDQSHLCRTFRRHEGMTPRGFRQRREDA